ncbi:MAG: TIGR02147 family protein [Bdellovibrionales bacterium]|nr:TIGR02147 family protein [Bdellovibrionales bacterium]
MSVFKYNEVRGYLKHYISGLPKNGRGEISRIAEHLGVSPTLVSHMLAGDKWLTPEQGHELVLYLGLVGIEADYFALLIQFERAGTSSLKKYWKSKMEVLKEQHLKLSNRLPTDRQLSHETRAIFYSSPLYMMIRLYTSVGSNGKTAIEIAQRFGLSVTKCTEAIKFLVDCGLCEEREGRYLMGQQKIHLEKSSPYLLRFQTDWRMKAINRGEDLADSELMFTAPVSLSKEDFESLRERTIEFIKQFLDTVHASPADEIACLNLDFFWVKK